MLTKIKNKDFYLEYKEKCFENIKIKISDVNDKKILFCGKIVSEKNTTGTKRCFFISPDNKYFFNVNSDTFIFEVEDEDVNEVKINLEYIIKNYSFMKWVDYHRKIDLEKKESLIYSVDIIRDYSYDEIDQQVYNLCHAINGTFNGECITVSSCCGHDSEPLWVACQFFTLNALTKLINILNSTDEFRENFSLHSSIHFSYIELQNPILQISTLKKGKTAYELAEKLAIYIQSIN